ncbi:MAG: hypothetical protein QF415_15460 [Candidatus Undinarchaeales archaeon]|nr:hypothetical protein [Candidatus Undinarchaeales archaeon]MDP7492811.1 hypothetical protein [Candidatus Undinarchaeales archaeon]
MFEARRQLNRYAFFVEIVVILVLATYISSRFFGAANSSPSRALGQMYDQTLEVSFLLMFLTLITAVLGLATVYYKVDGINLDILEGRAKMFYALDHVLVSARTRRERR